MRSFYVLVVVLLSAEAQTLPRDPVRLPAINPGRICPANQDAIRQSISAALLDRAIFSCGGTPGWRRIGNLDMTDPSQSCPTGLALKTYSAGLDELPMLHRPASPHCIKPAAPNIAKCVGGSRHTSLGVAVHSMAILQVAKISMAGMWKV